MADSQQPLDERMRLFTERTAPELAELRSRDERTLTPRMLVRKAMLLHFDEDSNGTQEEIEATLKFALERDDKYIEAYIELGRYYYSIQDDSEKAKPYLLKALDLLRGLRKEAVQGLLDCDEELHPDQDRGELQKRYEAILLEK